MLAIPRAGLGAPFPMVGTGPRAFPSLKTDGGMAAGAGAGAALKTFEVGS